MQMNPEINTDQQPHPHNQDTQGAIQNPTVELTRIDADDMEEFVRKYSTGQEQLIRTQLIQSST